MITGVYQMLDTGRSTLCKFPTIKVQSRENYLCATDSSGEEETPNKHYAASLEQRPSRRRRHPPGGWVTP